ncbi:MAG: hypothetical protein ACO3EG_07240, partial [Chitinophagaceae bacterium]
LQSCQMTNRYCSRAKCKESPTPIPSHLGHNFYGERKKNAFSINFSLSPQKRYISFHHQKYPLQTFLPTTP